MVFYFFIKANILFSISIPPSFFFHPRGSGGIRCDCDAANFNFVFEFDDWLVISMPMKRIVQQSVCRLWRLNGWLWLNLMNDAFNESILLINVRSNDHPIQNAMNPKSLENHNHDKHSLDVSVSN